MSIQVYTAGAWKTVGDVFPVGARSRLFINGSYIECIYTGSAWLPCDGSAISRTTYSDLFSVIATTFGEGDGSTTFNVPSALTDPILGTTHHSSYANRTSTLVVNSGSNTLNVWSAPVTMTGVPVGAKAAWCMATVYLSGMAPTVWVEAATGYTLNSPPSQVKYLGFTSILPGASVYGLVKIPLDSNRQFRWVCNVSNVCVGIGSAIDYET